MGAALLASVVALAGYLIASYRLDGFGFPLDDAWIHQTYARNLVQLGQWAFVPGHPSAGSTSPLWAVLEVARSLAGFGALDLVGGPGGRWAGFDGLGGGHVVGAQLGSGRLVVQAAVILLAFEWHLVWAALSGMETLLLAGAALSLLWGMQMPAPTKFSMGCAGGIDGLDPPRRSHPRCGLCLAGAFRR